MTSRGSEKKSLQHRRLATAIRRHVLRMTHRAKSSHVGTSLSMADVLAVLYEGVLRVDPRRPDWPDSDRFSLSRGHSCAGLCCVFAECGLLPLVRLGECYIAGIT